LEGKGAEEEEQICELLDVGDMGSLALAKGSMLAGWNAARVPLCSFGGGMQLRERPPATEWRFFQRKPPSKLSFGRGTWQDKLPAVRKKINKVFQRGYIWSGLVESTINFFNVEKGEDIRVVYNGTSCSLNDSLFAPSFWLPTAATASQPLMHCSWMGDADMGEMFLNLPIDKRFGHGQTLMRLS
jgi:hypothetical protein